MAPADWTVAAPAGLPRLVPATPVAGWDAHLGRLGPLPHAGATLIDEIDRAGLRGRGGASFPTAVKLAAVKRSASGVGLGRRRRPIVVANGTEGEPASKKDRVLLVHAPHLAIDGAVAAALAVGADEAVICVDRHRVNAVRAVQLALAERERAGGDPVAVGLATTPTRYLTGEESALVKYLSGGDAKPAFVPPRPFERGVDGRPTLVDNVETLADLALIARFGAPWWRTVGTPDDPGSFLLTASGAVAQPGVYELPFGVQVRAVLEHVGAEPGAAVLVGGYFGTWLAPELASTLRLSMADLRRADAHLGAGILVALPTTACPLTELANVATWLAGESAGQCGPCRFGLPAIAGALGDVAAGRRVDQALKDLRRWLPMVVGRGACKMPDGASRFVASGLSVFAHHVEQHRWSGACEPTAAVLPVPATDGGWR